MNAGTLWWAENFTCKKNHGNIMKNYVCVRGTSTATPTQSKITQTDANTGKNDGLQELF